jgi:hypothetical protein
LVDYASLGKGENDILAREIKKAGPSFIIFVVNKLDKRQDERTNIGSEINQLARLAGVSTLKFEWFAISAFLALGGRKMAVHSAPSMMNLVTEVIAPVLQFLRFSVDDGKEADRKLLEVLVQKCVTNQATAEELCLGSEAVLRLSNFHCVQNKLHDKIVEAAEAQRKAKSAAAAAAAASMTAIVDVLPTLTQVLNLLRQIEQFEAWFIWENHATLHHFLQQEEVYEPEITKQLDAESKTTFRTTVGSVVGAAGGGVAGAGVATAAATQAAAVTAAAAQAAAATSAATQAAAATAAAAQAAAATAAATQAAAATTAAAATGGMLVTGGIIVGGALVVGAAGLLLGPLAAPLIAPMFAGTTAAGGGLAGAAAVSSGLANLGGGAIVAGGAGMQGGLAVLGYAGAATGAAAGAGAGVAAAAATGGAAAGAGATTAATAGAAVGATTTTTAAAASAGAAGTTATASSTVAATVATKTGIRFALTRSVGVVAGGSALLGGCVGSVVGGLVSPTKQRWGAEQELLTNRQWLENRHADGVFGFKNEDFNGFQDDNFSLPQMSDLPLAHCKQYVDFVLSSSASELGFLKYIGQFRGQKIDGFGILYSANSNGINHALCAKYENGKPTKVNVLCRSHLALPRPPSHEKADETGSVCNDGLDLYCEVNYSTKSVTKRFLGESNISVMHSSIAKGFLLLQEKNLFELEKLVNQGRSLSSKDQELLSKEELRQFAAQFHAIISSQIAGFLVGSYLQDFQEITAWRNSLVNRARAFQKTLLIEPLATGARAESSGRSRSPSKRWGDGLEAPAKAGTRVFFPCGWVPQSVHLAPTLLSFKYTPEHIHQVIRAGVQIAENVSKLGLTVDSEHAAALFAYTEESTPCLYHELNYACRTPGANADAELEKHLDYMHHLSKAHEGLPAFRGTVYRGIDIKFGEKSPYEEDSVITWQQFSSASKNQSVAVKFLNLHSEGLFAADRPSGSMFVIESQTGKEISKFSAFTGEEEVLFKYNTFFKVHLRASIREEKIALLPLLAQWSDLQLLDVYLLKEI